MREGERVEKRDKERGGRERKAGGKEGRKR